MKIVIIADGKEQEGGTKEVISHIKRTLQNNDIWVEYVMKKIIYQNFFQLNGKKYSDSFI